MYPASIPSDSEVYATLAIKPSTTLLDDVRVAQYISLCSLTAVTWDWVLVLAEECRVAKRCGRSLSVLAYFLARFSAVIVCLLALIFYTGVPPGKNSCSTVFYGIGVFAVLGSAAKGYIFLLRIRAVYGNSIWVTICVFAGWLIVVGTRTTVGLLVKAQPFGQTGYCLITSLPSLPLISLWLYWAYDTCIFLAISIRLASHTTGTTTPWIMSFIRGYGLPRTMRKLLRDGQFYYFTTLMFLLTSAIVAGLPIDPIYQAIGAIPAVSIETIMTCKVFRTMILRSLEFERDPTNLIEGHLPATSIFNLDTSLQLQSRTVNLDMDLDENW